MKLEILHEAGPWKIVGELTDDDRSLLEESLAALGNNFQSNVDGLIALWDQLDRRGPKALGTSFYHYVDEQQSIYEFKKGRIRVLCFEIEGSICVCSHAILKTSQKIKKQDVNAAVAMRDRYLEAKRRNDLTFVVNE